MHKLFAVTTRGLESISADEMKTLGFSEIVPFYRRVEAFCSDLSPVAKLKTVDDVFIHLDSWQDVTHLRDELNRFTQRSADLDLEPALQTIRQIRTLNTPLRFSITSNFVGQRNYSVPEIKRAIADGILQRYPWIYAEDDEADINIRVFIEHDEAVVGVRLLDTPLHRRAYKVRHVPGSLKPIVASAMLQIAGCHPGQNLVDPFCGVGTILIEAGLCGLTAVGGDVDSQVLIDAQENAHAAQVKPHLSQWNTTRLPLADSSADVIVTNPPWGRQIVLDESIGELYRAAFAEMRRVVKPGGQIVILTTFPNLIDAVPVQQTEISLFGQTPTVLHIVN